MVSKLNPIIPIEFNKQEMKEDFMKKILVFLMVFNFSAAVFANQDSDKVMFRTNYNAVSTENGVDLRNVLKCVAATGLVLPTLVVEGFNQIISLANDGITSIQNREFSFKVSKCAAIRHKEILRGLVSTGCIIPYDELNFKSDFLDSFSEEESCSGYGSPDDLKRSQLLKEMGISR